MFQCQTAPCLLIFSKNIGTLALQNTQVYFGNYDLPGRMQWPSVSDLVRTRLISLVIEVPKPSGEIQHTQAYLMDYESFKPASF